MAFGWNDEQLGSYYHGLRKVQSQLQTDYEWCRNTTHNLLLYTLLANTLAFHKAREAKNTDLQALNRKLIQRCANSLSCDQEFSAPEVVSYLMNWGDRYISHHFEPIYISSVIAMLKQMFPQLDHRDERDEEEHKDDNVSVHENDHSEFHDALYRLNWQCWKSQIRESICEITSKNMSIEETHSKIIRSSISSSTLMTHQK